MRVNVKHIIEIAGGLFIGSLMSDAVDKVIEVSKEAVKNIKDKRAAN